MLEHMPDRIALSFPLREKDPGDYSSFRAGALRVRLRWYEAEGLGGVSLLLGSAMGGLMRLETLVIDPFARDLPLLTCDWIAAPGRRTLLAEYYDTLLLPGQLDAAPLGAVCGAFSDLKDKELGSHWYNGLKLPASFAKTGGRAAQPRMAEASQRALDAYLSLAGGLPLLEPEDRADKRRKAAAYVDGLLTHGGPSTDAFLRAIGPERTRALFTRIVFGTAE